MLSPGTCTGWPDYAAFSRRKPMGVSGRSEARPLPDFNFFRADTQPITYCYDSFYCSLVIDTVKAYSVVQPGLYCSLVVETV